MLARLDAIAATIRDKAAGARRVRPRPAMTIVMQNAKIAVTRKLAEIMHRILLTGEGFRLYANSQGLWPRCDEPARNPRGSLHAVTLNGQYASDMGSCAR